MAQFTILDNLKTIFGLKTTLRQLENSQNIYDYLETYLKTTSYDHLSGVFRQLVPISILRQAYCHNVYHLTTS